MARQRWDISSKGAVLPGSNDAEMNAVNSLQASAYYIEYNDTKKVWSDLKHNDHAIDWTFASGPIRIPDYAHAQILAITNHWIQIYTLVLYDFKMMITKQCFLT